MQLLTLPIMAELDKAKSILLVGAGGGFDIFCGLPLYFGLKKADKNVHLANLTFANVKNSTGQPLAPGLIEVNAATNSREYYFPELHLARWFKSQSQEVPIYCLERTGVQWLLAAYQHLVALHNIDAIVLIDGGTDSLMRGDEPGLGTPAEDASSIAAAHLLDIPTKLLVCLGFGIDTFHGVSHAYFLEAVADLTLHGGFLGAWSLTQDMPEVQLYEQACQAVFEAMPVHPSIVSSSIISALEGEFGDHHRTERTRGSQLFINPLMTLYWGFQLEAVARRNLYLEKIFDTWRFLDIHTIIANYRGDLKTVKPWIDLPM